MKMRSACLLILTIAAVIHAGEPTKNPFKNPTLWVDTYFENGSPLVWQAESDELVEIRPQHDHERFRPNQQLTHWNFKLHCAKSRVGQTVTLRFPEAHNVWNGMPGSALAKFKLALSVSADGENWKRIVCEEHAADAPAIEFKVVLESECMQIARTIPYTDSDLQASIKRWKKHADARIYFIGATAEGRPLEMIEAGNPAAPAIFLRARAHPWESGGSWLVEGLLDFVLSDDPAAADIRKSVNFCIMPMANKDGVHRGMTRFNTRGWDLNRNWFADKPIDPVLAPEAACLQNWFSERQRRGTLPQVAICIHNDNSGGLHLSTPSKNADAYYQRMEKFEKLLREGTIFREQSKGRAQGFKNSGTFGEGMCEIYGIDGLVWEIREEFADGLQRPPLHTDWKKLGADFAKVVQKYFQE